MTGRGVQIAPGSDEWLRFMSPSKAAAVLGVSRWESPRSLWHRMRGELPPEEPKDEFTVGHAFEPALAYLWKESNPGWRLSRGEVQVIGTERFGFPLLATVDRRGSRGSRRRVVEMKTARSLDDWGDDFSEDAPADYVVQTIVQRLVTGWTDEPADLLVMGPYFRHHCYRIPWDQELADEIIEQLRAFHASLADPDAAPELDDTVATYDAVRSVHPDIDDGAEVQLDADMAVDYLDAYAVHKAAEAELRLHKSRVLEVMGRAKVARVGDVKIADRRRKGRGVSLYAGKATSEEILSNVE